VPPLSPHHVMVLPSDLSCGSAALSHAGLRSGARGGLPGATGAGSMQQVSAFLKLDGCPKQD